MQSHLSWRSKSSLSTGLFSVKPLLHEWTIHIVVVGPALVAGVVRRVDVDALHPTGVAGQQRLERMKIIPMDDEVAVRGLIR